MSATSKKILADDKKEIKRCAIYTRVSTDEQANKEYSSLESQKEICEHYLKVHKEEGWKFTTLYDDPGYFVSEFNNKNSETYIKTELFAALALAGSLRDEIPPLALIHIAVSILSKAEGNSDRPS